MPCQNVSSTVPSASASASVGQSGNPASGATVVVDAGTVASGASVVAGSWVVRVVTVGSVSAGSLSISRADAPDEQAAATEVATTTRAANRSFGERVEECIDVIL